MVFKMASQDVSNKSIIVKLKKGVMKDKILQNNSDDKPKVYSHEQAVKAMHDYADQQTAPLREALEQIMTMKKQPGEENYNYAFNRCWNIADKALKEKE